MSSKTQITPLKLARYPELVEPGSPVRPIHWDVDPSTACDHACRGCPYIFDGPLDPMLGVIRQQTAKDKRTLLDYAAFIAFIQAAKGAGCEAITFVGGGEPTLHPQFSYMMAGCFTHGIKFGVITHLGRKYKPEFFTALQRATWVRVSVNAGTRETYFKHQGKDDFDHVLANIRTAAFNYDIRIGVSFLITNDNYGEIAEAAHVARQAGAAFIQYKPLIEVGEPGAAYAGLQEKILYALDAAKEAAADNFQVLDQWSSRLAELRQHHAKQFSGPCSVPRFNPKLGANGVVYTCCELAYNDDAALGSIYDEPLSTILERAGKRCGQIDMARCPQCWDKPVNTLINEGRFGEATPPPESVDQEFV